MYLHRCQKEGTWDSPRHWGRNGTGIGVDETSIAIQSTSPTEWVVGEEGRPKDCRGQLWKSQEVGRPNEKKQATFDGSSTPSTAWIKKPEVHTAGLNVQYRADKKLIFKRTRGATINPRPRMKSSRRGESRSAGYIFSDHFLTSYFFKQVKAWPQQKYNQQICIRLAEYSSSEVSGPSEVPRFVFKLIF